MKNVYINPIDYYVKATLEQNKIEFETQMEEITSNKINKMQEKIKKQKKLLKEKDKEIERLNNIINELEKWLNEEQVIYRDYLIRTPKFDSDYGANHLTLSNLTNVLDKLQELKGDSSNE